MATDKDPTNPFSSEPLPLPELSARSLQKSTFESLVGKLTEIVTTSQLRRDYTLEMLAADRNLTLGDLDNPGQLVGKRLVYPSREVSSPRRYELTVFNQHAQELLSRNDYQKRLYASLWFEDRVDESNFSFDLEFLDDGAPYGWQAKLSGEADIRNEEDAQALYVGATTVGAERIFMYYASDPDRTRGREIAVAVTEEIGRDMLEAYEDLKGLGELP